jgi:hypothetical protein
MRIEAVFLDNLKSDIGDKGDDEDGATAKDLG